MPRKVQKAKDLKGLFIYQDEHHGTVYFDIFSRNGYVLTSKDVRWYTLSIMFLPVAIILFYFALQFTSNFAMALVIAIGFYIACLIIYRFAFLYKLPCVENYNITKRKGIVENLSKNYSKQRLIVLIVMLVALFGLTIAYALTSGYEGLILYGLWGLVAVTFIFLIIVILALIKKEK